MSPPNAQRPYPAVMAIHSRRTSVLSGRREENNVVTSTTTSSINEETNATSNPSDLPVQPSTTTTAIIDTSARTSSSPSNPTSSSITMRGNGGPYPILRNLVTISNRGRTNLQNGNILQHLTTSSSSPSSSRSHNTHNNGPPAIHPQFRSKAVCKLTCSACTAVVCSRGMKAILLADTKVELYSTDSPPIGVQLVNDDYMTRNCRCRIRDVACLGCGSVVGYHVTTPCNTCLDACNNGHFWMFHAEGIHSSDRMDETGTKTLLWATIPCAERDMENIGKLREFLCR